MTVRIGLLCAVGLQFGLHCSASRLCETIGAVAHPGVERQKAIDRNWDGHQDVLHARMRAVVGAQEAMVRREPDALYALRQSLVDLAAISELVAEELPAPNA